MLTLGGSLFVPHVRPISQFPCLMSFPRMADFAFGAAATGAALSPIAAISAEGLPTKAPAKVRHR